MVLTVVSAAFQSTRLGDQVAARGARECADSLARRTWPTPRTAGPRNARRLVLNDTRPAAHAQTPGPPLRSGRLRRLALPHSGGTALRRAEIRKVLIDIADGDAPRFLVSCRRRAP